MSEIEQIYDDKREIESIHWDDAEESFIEVGDAGYTKILAYPEHAEFCNISYLAVYVGDEIKQRLRASTVRIIYKTSQSPTPDTRGEE
jgi:hypothetical protein